MSKLHDIFIDHYGETLLAKNADEMEAAIKKLISGVIGTYHSTEHYGVGVISPKDKAVNEFISELRTKIQDL